MEQDVAQNISRFLVNLHQESLAFLSECRVINNFKFLNERNAPRYGSSFFYSGLSGQQLEVLLGNFFVNPRGQTPYLLMGYERREGWLKLLRFVAASDSDINAEAVFLKGASNDDLMGFGYRYEHPEAFPDERPDDPGKHAFFHIQPISRTVTDVDIPRVPGWFSHRFPSFFMFASCGYELVIYAIHSLSGWERLRSYWGEHKDPNWMLSRLVMVGGHARAPFPELQFIAEESNSGAA